MAISFAKHSDLVDDADPISGCARLTSELELAAIEAEDLGDSASSSEHELQERAGAYAVIRRGVASVQEPFHALLSEVSRVGARLRGFGELDLLGTGNGEVEKRTELEQAT